MSSCAAVVGFWKPGCWWAGRQAPLLRQLQVHALRAPSSAFAKPMPAADHHSPRALPAASGGRQGEAQLTCMRIMMLPLATLAIRLYALQCAVAQWSAPSNGRQRHARLPAPTRAAPALPCPPGLVEVVAEDRHHHALRLVVGPVQPLARVLRVVDVDHHLERHLAGTQGQSGHRRCGRSACKLATGQPGGRAHRRAIPAGAATYPAPIQPQSRGAHLILALHQRLHELVRHAGALPELEQHRHLGAVGVQLLHRARQQRGGEGGVRAGTWQGVRGCSGIAPRL
jgi:hypothetical protein